MAEPGLPTAEPGLPHAEVLTAATATFLELGDMCSMRLFLLLTASVAVHWDPNRAFSARSAAAMHWDSNRASSASSAAVTCFRP